MSAKDAVYYVGLIVGIIVGTLVTRSLALGPIYQIIGGLGTGVGLGFVAERVYSGLK